MVISKLGFQHGWVGSPDKDLCDRLLERGVLVYDSARELLAIDVRQRKEQLAPEVSWSGRAWENHDLGTPKWWWKVRKGNGTPDFQGNLGWWNNYNLAKLVSLIAELSNWMPKTYMITFVHIYVLTVMHTSLSLSIYIYMCTCVSTQYAMQYACIFWMIW